MPIHYLEKKECWQTLTNFLEVYSPKNIIVVRDLNIVLDPKEKRGGISGRDQMFPLVEDMIQQWDLLEFKPKKGLYTWNNNKVEATHI